MLSKIFIYSQIAKLSFCPDDDEDEENDSTEDNSKEEESDQYSSEGEPEKGFKMIKNPDVDTSFLPDRDREDAENRLREELRQVRGNVAKLCKE